MSRRPVPTEDLRREVAAYQRHATLRLWAGAALAALLVLGVAAWLLAGFWRTAEEERAAAEAAMQEAEAERAAAEVARRTAEEAQETAGLAAGASARLALRDWAAGDGTGARAYSLALELGLAPDEALAAEAALEPGGYANVLALPPLDAYAPFLELLVAHTAPDAPGFVFSKMRGGTLQISDSFAPGETPVIDLQIPPYFADWFVRVSIADFESGQVLHIADGTDRIARTPAWRRSLAPGTTAVVQGGFVRVAWPRDAGQRDPSAISLIVDDAARASTLVFALLSQETPFDPRPRTESLEAFLAGLPDRFPPEGAGEALTSFRILRLGE